MHSYNTGGCGSTSIGSTPDHVPDVLDEVIGRLTHACERVESLRYVLERTNTRLGVGSPKQAGGQIAPATPPPSTVMGLLERLHLNLDDVNKVIDEARR